jgi:hypothetical protein
MNFEKKKLMVAPVDAQHATTTSAIQKGKRAPLKMDSTLNWQENYHDLTVSGLEPSLINRVLSISMLMNSQHLPKHIIVY